MSRKKKRKGLLHSRFYQIYFGVVALSLVLIAAGTVWLTGYLRDLEAAQPVYVAHDVARLFENGDFERLYALDSSAQAIAEGDKAFYVDNMKKIAAGKNVAWSEGFTEREDAHRYNVTLNGDRFAAFTLVPSGETDRRGNMLWTLGGVQTYVEVERTPEPTPTPEPVTATACRVTAPEGCVVTVNGMTLNSENAAVTQKPLYEDGFLPPTLAAPVMVTYDCAAEGEAIQVSVTDQTGAAMDVRQTGEHAWSCGLREDMNLRARYADAAWGLAKKIAKFTSRDGGKKGILQYCAANSPARTTFDNLSNTFATPHSGIDFQNQAVSEFYAMSDNCFTCRVTFDYLLNTKEGTRTDPTAYTFCIVLQEKGARLYNLLMQ